MEDYIKKKKKRNQWRPRRLYTYLPTYGYLPNQQTNIYRSYLGTAPW